MLIFEKYYGLNTTTFKLYYFSNLYHSFKKITKLYQFFKKILIVMGY
jgi:hypothetical protein